MIASDRTLDLKQFARAIGQKKATMTTKRGAEATTGLKTGGIGALALTMKHWGVYLDEQAKQHEAIFVNGGQRGVNLKIKVDDLVRVLNAKVVDVSKPMDGAEDDAEGENKTRPLQAMHELEGYRRGVSHTPLTSSPYARGQSRAGCIPAPIKPVEHVLVSPLQLDWRGGAGEVSTVTGLIC